MGKIFLYEKLNNGIGYVLIALLAVAAGFLAARQPVASIFLLLAPVGVIVFFACLLNAEAGIYINTIYSFFIYFIDRVVSPGNLPIGILADVLIFSTFTGLFVQKINWRQQINQFTKSQIGIWVLILFFYLLIQLFNPYANSFTGWYQAFRKILGAILFFFVCFKVFDNYASIRRYLIFLFGMTVIVAFYGCMQQWLGFFSFDKESALASLKAVNITNFEGEFFRKFSTFPDSSSFGIIMAACAVLYTIIGLNQTKSSRRGIIFSGVLLMILAMGYSSTRTANAMLVAGFFLYCLLTFNLKSTRIFSVIAVFLLLIILYAPIYSNHAINRFRTTFTAQNDDSYQLRVRNRNFIQPYIYSHPIGGGLGTTAGIGLTNNPGHFLAGFMPDSGYLMKVLETGIIGLIIVCFLYFFVLKQSVNGFFRVREPVLKTIYAGATASLFTFYVGEYAQMALGQITDVVVYYPLIAIVMQADKFDNNSETNSQAESNI